MRRKIIGKKDFHGSVDITDPCYNRDVWCRMNDIKIKEGSHTCMVWLQKETYKDDDGTRHSYDRVGIIGIYLDPKNIPPQNQMEEIGEIGVDAGLAGFFHNKPDYTNEEWHNLCEKTRDGLAWIFDEGFFSSSGYGDGAYGVYARKVNGEISDLEIRFM